MTAGALKNKIKKIKVLAVDVDGVLTDGKIVYDAKGQEIKFFDAHDGMGMVFAKRAGLKTAIISAKSVKAVKVRARDLEIDKVYQNAYPKLAAYGKMLEALKAKDEEVCFVGDDLPDMIVLERVGLAVAVKNAAPEVKAIADYETRNYGGNGAVREVVELILKSQGKWNRIVKRYSSGKRR